MEIMLPPELSELAEPIRPLKRVEFDRLVDEGYFEDERVELLFGMVVEMAPIDPAHQESLYQLRRRIERAIGDRAVVRENNPLAASEISEPQPDVVVLPPASYWKEHPARAYLVIEVARSSLRRDRGIKRKLYGLAQVDEYWIVNHVDEVVEVYRESHDGVWGSTTIYRRGDTIALFAFPDVTIAVSDVLPPTA